MLSGDLFLKIESKLLCLSDSKALPSFQFATVSSVEDKGGGSAGGVQRSKGGGEEDLKKW